MPGGLVQLATYGSQDLFLTGSPQITFFRVLYRRHSNFSTESIPQHFLGDINFGSESSSVIDKIGDLMSRVYLEIDIPKIDLIKNRSNWNLSKDEAKKQYDQINEFYQLLYTYISINTDILRKIGILLKTNNIRMNEIELTINNNNFIGNLAKFRKELQMYITKNNNFDTIEELRDDKTDFIQEINQIDAQKYLNSVIKEIFNKNKNHSTATVDIMKRRALSDSLHFIYSRMREFYLKVYNIYLTKQKLYQSFLDGSYTERYKFAWVEELGHSIIDKIEIMIGGNVIDRHTGDWLVLFNKIFLREYQMENYYKMIGNIPGLTIFDDQVKNSYKLVIPFQFWFCRNTGSSLPLIALRYHDVMFNVKLKNLSDICYTDENPFGIENLQSLYGINITDTKLYVDYVFLDTDERKRFAQSTHEYLIETVQYNEFTDITGKQYHAHLTFDHPTKFIIWFLQPNQYRSNPNGTNKCQWNNFGTRHDKTGYTMKTAVLRINTYDRTDANHDIKYFNYVQAYLYFNNSPTDGFNVYSFSIKPMEHQPSGSLNLSRIDDFSILMVFTDEFVELIGMNNTDGIQTGAYMGAYTVSYNILRIMGGMAGMAFRGG